MQPDIKVFSAIHAGNINGFVYATRPSDPKAKVHTYHYKRAVLQLINQKMYMLSAR